MFTVIPCNDLQIIAFLNFENASEYISRNKINNESNMQKFPDSQVPKNAPETI